MCCTQSSWCRRETNDLIFGGAVIMGQGALRRLKLPAMILDVDGMEARWSNVSAKTRNPIAV